MAFIAFNGLLPHECVTSLRYRVDHESPYELRVHEWLMTQFDKIGAWLTLHAQGYAIQQSCNLNSTRSDL